MLEIACISLNHKVTPLEAREKVAFPGREEAVAFARRLRETCALEEVLLLSTCNRTELYSVCSAVGLEEQLERQLAMLAEEGRFVPRTHPANFATVCGPEAVRHLFRVASGMESQILGESQILAQVKESHAWAHEAEVSGRILHRLGERALRVGKRVRTETSLGDGAVSASYAALELARKVFGKLESRSVLVIGVGEIAMLTVQSLPPLGAGRLTIMNRTVARAVELAERFGARARDLSELLDALVEADLVISSTGSSRPLANARDLKKVRQRRSGRPLLIIDLAMPRDFDPACGHLDQVFLKNLDDLQEIVQFNSTARERELPAAESIVESEQESFSEWLHTLGVEPTIRELRAWVERIRQEELDTLEDLGDAALRRRVDELTRRMVNRILHLPSENLKRHLGLRDHDVKRVVHELLTQEISHPRADRPDPQRPLE